MDSIFKIVKHNSDNEDTDEINVIYHHLSISRPSLFRVVTLSLKIKPI